MSNLNSAECYSALKHALTPQAVSSPMAGAVSCMTQSGFAKLGSEPVALCWKEVLKL